MPELYLEQVLGECRNEGDSWNRVAGRVLDRLSSDPEAARFRQKGEEELYGAIKAATVAANGYERLGLPGPTPARMFFKVMCERFELDPDRFT